MNDLRGGGKRGWTANALTPEPAPTSALGIGASKAPPVGVRPASPLFATATAVIGNVIGGIVFFATGIAFVVLLAERTGAI